MIYTPSIGASAYGPCISIEIFLKPTQTRICLLKDSCVTDFTARWILTVRLCSPVSMRHSGGCIDRFRLHTINPTSISHISNRVFLRTLSSRETEGSRSGQPNVFMRYFRLNRPVVKQRLTLGLGLVSYILTMPSTTSMPCAAKHHLNWCWVSSRTYYDQTSDSLTWPNQGETVDVTMLVQYMIKYN